MFNMEVLLATTVHVFNEAMPAIAVQHMFFLYLFSHLTYKIRFF